MIIRRFFSDGSSKSADFDHRVLHLVPPRHAGEISTVTLNATIIEDVFTHATDASDPNSATAIARARKADYESSQIIDESGDFKANRMTLYQIDVTDRSAWFPYDGSTFLVVLRYEPFPERAIVRGIEDLLQDPNAVQTL